VIFYNITVFHFKSILFIAAMAKLQCQQPLLQSSVLHDPSEMILIYWFGAQETSNFRKLSISPKNTRT